MTRARSGSFYCPIPDESVLSIAQKAAISTAPMPSSSLLTTTTSAASPVGGRLRRHVRTPSSLAPLAPVNHADGAHQHDSSMAPAARAPHSHSVQPQETICQSDKVHSQQGALGSSPSASAPSRDLPSTSSTRTHWMQHHHRHPWSPTKPSPLRRIASGSKPLCPSALWTTHPELLPLYASQSAPDVDASSSSSSAYRTRCSDAIIRPSLYRSVLRADFLSGPMAEKARIYGLRVAWCIYGDVREQLAKEIFVSGSRAGYAPSTRTRSRRSSSSSSVSSLDSDDIDHVEVVQPEPTDLQSVVVTVPSRASFEWGVEEPLMKEDDAFGSPDLSSLDSDGDESEEEEDEDSLSEYSNFSDTSSDTESVEMEEIELDHEFALDFGVHV